MAAMIIAKNTMEFIDATANVALSRAAFWRRLKRLVGRQHFRTPARNALQPETAHRNDEEAASTLDTPATDEIRLYDFQGSSIAPEAHIYPLSPSSAGADEIGSPVLTRLWLELARRLARMPGLPPYEHSTLQLQESFVAFIYAQR